VFDLILKNISRHIQLTQEETDFFTGILQVKKLRRRQYLVQEGNISRMECYINKGCLRSYHLDDKGIEHVVQFGIEDWWIGDMHSFITGRPAKFNVDALEDSELLCIDKNDLEILYAKVPKFERFFRILIQNSFVVQQERILNSMMQSAEQRYLNFIERYPQFEQRLPQHQVASYLGISPETLSRIRKQIAEKK